jgi:hypothetical protein
MRSNREVQDDNSDASAENYARSDSQGIAMDGHLPAPIDVSHLDSPDATRLGALVAANIQ